MRYLALVLLFLPSLMFAEIVIDSGGFNETIRSSIKKADQRVKAERERKRLEWERQKQNYTPTSGSTQSNSSASSGNSSQGSIYICTFDCKGSDGTRHSIIVSAPSNHKAQIQSENLGTKQCRSMGFRDGIQSHWGTGSTDCRKR